MNGISFQALVPCSYSPSRSPFHGCLEELLFPTCVQRPEDLPFSLKLPAQLIYNGGLKQVCRACPGAGFSSWLWSPESNAGERGMQRSPRQLAWARSRKTTPLQCCTQANKPPGRARLACHPSRVLSSLDSLSLQSAFFTVPL